MPSIPVDNHEVRWTLEVRKGQKQQDSHQTVNDEEMIKTVEMLKNT